MTDAPQNPDAARDAENLRVAIEHLAGTHETWHRQAALAVGRPIEFVVDYESLGGRYDLLRPLIHRSLTDGLGALAAIGFGEASNAKLRLRAVVRKVVIRAPRRGDHGMVTLLNGELAIHPRLDSPGGSLQREIAEAILKLLAPDATGTIYVDTDTAVRRAMEATVIRDPPESAEPVVASDETDAELRAFDRFMRGDPDADPDPRDAGLDVYARAGKYMDELEAKMREAGCWPDGPPPEPLEIRGAFGGENMAFEQWLAWVLVPRVREIIVEKGEFPASSEVGAYAVRALDGAPWGGELVDVLSRFDWLIRRGGKSRR